MSATLTQMPIECSKPPILQIDGYTVRSHQTMPDMVWDPGRLDLYTSRRQQERTGINGQIILVSKMSGRHPLNANFLDWLLVLENQQLIPAHLVNLNTCFWGTTYEKDGVLYVRYLQLRDNGSTDPYWRWKFAEVNSIFHAHFPAALLK